MKKAEKIICDFMHSFVEKNYKKINLQKVESIKSKKTILEDVKNNFEDAVWVLTEVCQWGMDKVYLEELYVKTEISYDFYIIKIGTNYIKLEYTKCMWVATLCKPKYKRVMYFG
jgi:hypothetical protein